MRTLLALIVTAQSAAAAEQPPEYADTFDFGTISTDSQVDHMFTVSNSRAQTLKIVEADSTCQFVQVLSYTQQILPRRRGQLRVRLLPAKTGRLECDVSLVAGGSPPWRIRYQLKGRAEGEAAGGWKGWEQLGISRSLLTRRLRRRNASLAISVEAVLRRLETTQPPLLVDVRHVEAFETYRIPGSMNIPLFALKTRVFLKRTPLVLVDEGQNWLALQEQSKLLTDAGFLSVSILDGGIERWRQGGGALEGDLSRTTQLNRISPKTYFRERSLDDWAVVSVCESEKTAARYLLPEAIEVPLLRDWEAVVLEISQWLRKRRSEHSRSVLIVDDQGLTYPKMEPVLHRAGVENVFFLRGGLEAYKEFLQKQTVAQQEKGSSLKRVRQCPGCRCND